jgi:hypothetical protein
MWWEAKALEEQRRDPELEERERRRAAEYVSPPLPRDEAFLRETLAAYKQESTLAEYTRRRDQYYVYGVIAMLEWALGLRHQTPIYGRDKPVNCDSVSSERANADDQMRGREEPTGRPMAYYRGVENSCSWLLGDDMWLDPPQLQPGFVWEAPRRGTA